VKEKPSQMRLTLPQGSAGAELAPIRPPGQKYFEQMRRRGYLLTWVAAKISLFV
jgi:hypothetical protein